MSPSIDHAEPSEPMYPDGPEILDRVFHQIHNGPTRLVDVYMAVFHIDGDVVLDGRDERALREASAWLGQVEGYEIPAETLAALADQRDKVGIRPDDVAQLRTLVEQLAFGDSRDRFQELATVDPKDVV